jgi:NTP pyrophosphatase (non-canonical NTP hydrolase)
VDQPTATTYVAGVFAQLRAAVADGDRDAAERIIDQVDSHGHVDAAAAMAAGLDQTSLCRETVDHIVAEAARIAVDQLVAVSRWIDNAPANAARNPESLDWIRNAKVAEEAGEVINAMNQVSGANPRKAVTGSMSLVNKELLDVALAALAAYEHNTGHLGFSMAALFSHVEATHARAGLDLPGGNR